MIVTETRDDYLLVVTIKVNTTRAGFATGDTSNARRRFQRWPAY
jgi:hypothetical protein